MVETAINYSRRVNYPDLDLVKLLMAFLVVEIHTRPLMGFPFAERIIEGIDVIAVPFFFLASAFLCFRGLDEASFADKALPGAARVRRMIGKLLRLYLTWTVLFLPVTVFGSVIHGDGLVHALAIFARGTLLIGENYYSWPLWYLLASVVGFALVYICLRGGCAQGVFSCSRLYCCWSAMGLPSSRAGKLRRQPFLFPSRSIARRSAARATESSRASSMWPWGLCSA